MPIKNVETLISKMIFLCVEGSSETCEGICSRVCKGWQIQRYFRHAFYSYTPGYDVTLNTS